MRYSDIIGRLKNRFKTSLVPSFFSIFPLSTLFPHENTKFPISKAPFPFVFVFSIVIFKPFFHWFLPFQKTILHLLSYSSSSTISSPLFSHFFSSPPLLT